MAGTVTIKLVDVRVSTALDAVSDSIRAAWRIEVAPDGGRRLRFTAAGDASPLVRLSRLPSLEEKLSLSLVDAPLTAVLDSFGRILGASVEIDSALVDRKVTVELEQVAAREAIEAIATLHGLRVEILSEEPLSLRFSPAE